MDKWKKIKVSDIGKVITGKTPKTSESDNYGGEIPFLTPSDDMTVKYVRNTNKTLTDKGKVSVKNMLLPANTVCVSCIGSDLGKVAITTKETITNQQINSIIVDTEKYNVDYIYYSMLILGKVLNHHSKTSTAVPIVNKTSFSNYEIVVPTKDVQTKTASILSRIDDKIDQNTNINNNLPPHPCNARIAAKQRRQTPKTDKCLHTDGKVSGRGGNEETAEQFSSILVA